MIGSPFQGYLSQIQSFTHFIEPQSKPNLDGVHVVGGWAEYEVLEGLGAGAQLQPHCEGGPRTKLPQIKHWTHFKMETIEVKV